MRDARDVMARPVCAQELCTCSLRMVMERGAIQHNPSAPVRASGADHATACLRVRYLTHAPALAPTRSQGTITSLLLHVAWGLEYLHSKGIIHGGAPQGRRLDAARVVPQCARVLTLLSTGAQT